jgi:hypothetical protein
MKTILKTINVIETLDGFVMGIASFPYTLKGRKEAEKLAAEIIKDGCAGDGPTKKELKGLVGDEYETSTYHPEESSWYVIITPSRTKYPFID